MHEKMAETARILIGGDVCLSGGQQVLCMTETPRGLFGEILPELESADFSLVNLECPLTSSQREVRKSGPCLKGATEFIKTVRNAHIRAVNLANNHIMDYGVKGLCETIEMCKQENVDLFGAGANYEEASKPLATQVNSIRLAFMGMAENEGFLASTNRSGANPIDVRNFFKVMELKKSGLDYLVVLLHAGKEYSPLPSPSLLHLCHFLADVGADAIICQHSHCVGSYEAYGDSLIVYGQGNLYFPPFSFSPPSWDQGVLVELSFSKNKAIGMKYKFIPFVNPRGKIGIKRLSEIDERHLLDDFEKRSAVLRDYTTLERAWETCCLNQSEKLLYQLMGSNRIFRYLLSKLNVRRYFFNEEWYLWLKNIIQCETHRDMAGKILDDHLKKRFER